MTVRYPPGIALPEFLSTPRPNGSRALGRAVGEVEARLEGLGVAVQSHHFTLRPYAMELLGLWLLLGGLLLPLAGYHMHQAQSLPTSCSPLPG